MEKHKSLILTLVLFLCVTKVNAAACNNSLKVNYQEKAKNISYSYKYEDSNNTFNITFTNIDSSFYLIDMESMQKYDYANGEMTINNVAPGKSYRFNVFTKDNNPCSRSSIYPIYVTLPYYNPYYTDSLCDGISNYQYCKKFINKNISYEEFQNNVTKYRQSLEKSENVKKNNYYESIFKTLLNIYLNYYFIILPVIIIASIIIIVRHDKKQELF